MARLKAWSDKKRIFFETKNIKLELKNKVNINTFIEFFMGIYAELVIARNKLKKKEFDISLEDIRKTRMN